MSEPERLVPAITLFCAVPDGEGVAHGAAVAVLGLDAAEVVRIDGARMIEWNGESCWIAPCPKHGVLVVRDSEVRTSFRRRRSLKVLKLGVSTRLPVLKTHREREDEEEERQPGD